LNRELGISICLLFIVNISRFTSGSLWFLLSDISLIPGVVVAASVIMVILWGVLFLMPIVQVQLMWTLNDEEDNEILFQAS
jgi:hypothetical protein